MAGFFWKVFFGKYFSEQVLLAINDKDLSKIEVREIDKSQEQKKLGEKQGSNPTITESAKEALIPTVHASDDEKEACTALKIGAGGALAAASLYPPTAPVAQALSASEFVVGAAVEKIGEANDNKELEEGGKIAKEVGEIGSLPSIAQGGVEKLIGT
ncbi:19165_t:CDS:2 [Dentiscutata erythropus]|uniref:19165_t:CDS:1 n=1 Tax=Dentiscutata erythropus TaxID=1348616 RepID=A0A9N9GQV3_9GLOM|nr:19165_t:CDS:2 [Dentiscutata erythropus]